ncbi:unnamed protein product [Durusdinium trenchii]|uniref:carbonic anhydrase n=1 Tax=Durusdinium trenchii TaxID=1381693 RepID=A0ABP0RE62_9DINO
MLRVAKIFLRCRAGLINTNSIGEILLALPAPRLFPGLWIFEQQASTCYTPRYTSQSPIDIPKQLDKVEQKNLTTLGGGEEGARLGSLAWSLLNDAVNVTLHPGPVTWEVRMTNPAAILVQLEGVDYTLQSISFKSPSEHTVQGAHNAMEVQLYHTGKDFQGAERRLLVSVSLAQREDAWNKFLDPIFNAMPQDGAGTPSIMISNPWSDLAPPDRSFVTYDGSTTAPPCEAATWVVFMQPGFIGVRQLEQFRSGISGYQPSRLAPANSTRPLGLSDLWDSRWGYNSRNTQALNYRPLSLVQMANAPPPFVPKQNFEGSTSIWPILICIMLFALLVTGCLLAVLTRIKRHKEEYGHGCCDDSDEEEDVRSFQQLQSLQQGATLLSPLPDPYMHMAPARAGFGKHNQIYLA